MAARRPFWLLLVATLLVVLATAALGRWQLARAQHKEALQAHIDAHAALPPQPLEALLPGQASGADWLAQHQYRTVRLRGRWLSGHTLYLDNRQMHKRPGFFVLTPLELASGAGVVMVQRGWAPRDFQDRTRVPALADPPGWVELSATIDGPPARLLEWRTPAPTTSEATPEAAAAGAGDAADAARASPIRQNVGLTDFAQATGVPVFTAFSVRQSSAAADGLLRDWPQPAVGVHTHYGYAAQWFGLSALAAGLFVWFQLVRSLRQRHA